LRDAYWKKAEEGATKRACFELVEFKRPLERKGGQQ
jgi:hypothetical protein